MSPQHCYILNLLIEHNKISEDLVSQIFQSFPESLSGDDLERYLFNQLIQDHSIPEDQLIGWIAEAEGLQVFQGSKQDIIHGCKEDHDPFDRSRFVNFDPIPVKEETNCITVLCSFPCNYAFVEALEQQFDKTATIQLTSSKTLEWLRGQLYQSDFKQNDSLTKGFSSENDTHPDHVLIIEESGHSYGSMNDYLDQLIQQAIQLRASDIHIEPMSVNVIIRCRVDGVLRVLDEPTKVLHQPLISCVKLLADLDIAQKRCPQDGSFHFDHKLKDYDFRVSVLPSTHGESVAIRILEKRHLRLGFEDLGMSEYHLRMFERVIATPDGIFLVTGPTGAGKSTTLYSALNYINEQHTKIITVEDPIEFSIKNINQVQVNSSVGLSFSSALKAILRQAPDVIMIGEIRDHETMDIAIKASLTGHTIFSSLHTNDSLSAIIRLLDMGAEPYLLASAVRAVLAQRLVRFIPEEHRLPYSLTSWQAHSLGEEYLDLQGKTFWHAGIKRNLYSGRLGVFEMFEIDEKLSDYIYHNRSLSLMKTYLVKTGFRNMRQDAVEKALQGLTSLEDVLAVTVANEYSGYCVKE